MFSKLKILVSTALVCAIVCAIGCEPDNTKKVNCHNNDCEATCMEQGFPTGECVDNTCVCEQPDNQYEWDSEDAGSNPDSGE